MQIKGAFSCLIKDGKFLLIKNDYNPKWFFPGGEIKENEDPRETVKREFMEELGMEVKVLELISINEKTNFSHKYQQEADYLIYHFLCESDDKPIKREDVIEEIKYFSPSNLESINVSDEVRETVKRV